MTSAAGSGILSDTMSRQHTLTTLDQALDGAVTALIVRRRAEGRSAAVIRDELRDEHRITVSERTVSRAIARLEQPTEPAEASS